VVALPQAERGLGQGLSGGGQIPRLGLDAPAQAQAIALGDAIAGLAGDLDGPVQPSGGLGLRTGLLQELGIVVDVHRLVDLIADGRLNLNRPQKGSAGLGETTREEENVAHHPL
jgi:hypothetical protein